MQRRNLDLVHKERLLVFGIRTDRRRRRRGREPGGAKIHQSNSVLRDPSDIRRLMRGRSTYVELKVRNDQHGLQLWAKVDLAEQRLFPVLPSLAILP